MGRRGLYQDGGGLQRVVAAPPGLPEDALLTLLPMPRDGVAILAVQVGVTAGAEPPATCQGQRKGDTVKPMGLQWGQGGEGAGCWPSPALDKRTLAVVVRLCSEEPQLVTKAPWGLRAPPHPILVNAALTSLTLASYFSTLATW